MSRIDPTVFCLAETWHSKSITNSFFGRYQIVESFGERKHRQGRNSLGYVIGIRNGEVFNVLYKDRHFCVINLTHNVIIFAYIPPQTSNVIYSSFISKSKELMELYKHNSIYLIGDINCRIGEKQVSVNSDIFIRSSNDKISNKRGTKLLHDLNSIDIDLSVVNGCSIGDIGGEFTYVTSNGASVIDLCIVNGVSRSQLSKFEVINISHSKHFPICLSAGKSSIKPVLVSKITKILWDPCKYEEFKDLLVNCTETYDGTVPGIVNSLYRAATQCGLVKEIKLDGGRVLRGAIWYNSDCVQAKKQVAVQLRRLRKAKRKNGENLSNLLCQYTNSKKKLREIETCARRSFFTDISDKLRNAKDSKAFFKAIDLYRNRKGSNTTTNITVPINTFRDFFSTVYRQEIEEHAVNRTKSESSFTVEELDKVITIEELELAIKKLGKNKAPGSDGIPNEIWKGIPDNVKLELLKCFNDLFDNNVFPNNWSEIIISPLYKKSDPNLPSNYRPISLANTILKLFTQVLSNRVLDWSERNKIISDYQAAYKRKSGCRDHIFLLSTALQYNFSINRKVYGLFVDLSQAFDTINHNRLWIKLTNAGLSTKMVKTLRSIYSLAKAKVRTKYGISNSFPIEKGVLQGETISPILWNLYLEDLVQTLERSDTIPIKIIGASIHALLYADDIILLAYTPAELQKKINILSKYLEENGLRVNLSKTKYMVFSKRKDTSNLIIRWNSQIIERVSSYVYLGVPFTEQLNFEFVKNHFLEKSKRALRDLESLIFRSRMNDFVSIMSLFHSLIRSVFSYCCPIWGLRHSDCFEQLRIQFLKSLFCLPCTIPAFFVRLELDIKTSEVFFVKLCLKYIINLSNKDKESIMYKAYSTMKTICEYKKSWYKDVISMCQKWECENLLQLVDDESLSIGSRINRITRDLSIIEFNSVSSDIAKMRKTKLLKLYNTNKTHCIFEPYLSYNVSWRIKQLIMQLKLGISHITHKGKKVKLQKLEHMYKYVDSSICQLCGKAEEDSYHVIFNCPHYITERIKFVYNLSTYNSNYSHADYLKMFNNLSQDDALKLFHFFDCSLTRRRLYLEDITDNYV